MNLDIPSQLPLTLLLKLEHLLQTPIPPTVVSQNLFVFVNIRKVKLTTSITEEKFYCKTFLKINQNNCLLTQYLSKIMMTRMFLLFREAKRLDGS
jgi:hypothetical protein